MFQSSEGKRITVSFRDVKTEKQYSEDAMTIMDTVDYYLSQSKTFAIGGVNLYGENLGVYVEDDEYTNDLKTGDMLLGVMDGSKTIAIIPFTRNDTLVFSNMLIHANNTYMTTLEIKSCA